MSDNDFSNITVIIPAAGVGKRMKSYGPKPLIMVGESTVINMQIATIKSNINARDIILVCGFKADKLMNETPDSIVKIENESYEDNNVIRSIGIALRATRDTDTVVIVYGDLVFNSAAIEHLNLEKSCVVIDNDHMTDDEIGCIIDKRGNLANMMYDLPIKWGGAFECIRHKDIKIVDIDTSKDIKIAIGILT